MNTLEAQIAEYLGNIHIDEEIKDWAIKYLNELNDKEIQDRTAIYKSQQDAYNKSQEHLDELTKMCFRGLLTDEEYMNKKENSSKRELVSRKN